MLEEGATVIQWAEARDVPKHSMHGTVLHNKNIWPEVSVVPKSKNCHRGWEVGMAGEGGSGGRKWRQLEQQ